jgi:hypothetical protein
MSNPIKIKIGDMESDKVEFDAKLLKDITKIMKSSAEGAVKGSSDFELDGKAAKGYAISGRLTQLKKEVKGKDQITSCTVTFILAELPQQKILSGKYEGTAKVKSQPSDNPKDLKGDAEACVEGATKDGVLAGLKKIKTL